MRKKDLGLLTALLVLMVLLVTACTPKDAAQTPAAPGSKPTDAGTGNAQAGAGNASAGADPQKLLVPRWFLTGLTLDGQGLTLEGKQPTLQFKPDGTANGEGGCNQFGTVYQASADGKLQFGQITATMMACDQGMQQESAYLKALAQVQQFKMDGMKLTLLSADGKTALNFSLPPK